MGDLLEAACEQGLHDTVLPDLLDLLAALLEADRAAIAEGCEGAQCSSRNKERKINRS